MSALYEIRKKEEIKPKIRRTIEVKIKAKTSDKEAKK